MDKPIKKPRAVAIRTCSADMGSIKIYNEGLACFFDNGFGDAPSKVRIYETKVWGANPKMHRKESRFLGHFTVRPSKDGPDISTYLSAYDCDDDECFEFKPGRWFVILVKPLEFVIELEEEGGLEC